MAEDLRVVASFSTPAEADISRNSIESHGIRAFLADEHSVGWLWHLGVALHGIKVLVPESELVRAAEILAPFEKRQAETWQRYFKYRQPVFGPNIESAEEEEWVGKISICSNCGEQNAECFDICWSCSAALEDAELFNTHDDEPPPADLSETLIEAKDSEPEETPEDDQPTLPECWTCSKCETSVTEELELCWACGTTVDGIEDPDFQSELSARKTDDGLPDPDEYFAETRLYHARVHRVCLTAILGLVWCPPLLNVYSTWLILHYDLRQDAAKERTTFYVYGALALNVLALAPALFLLLFALYQIGQ